MSDRLDLAQILADLRGDAAVLRRSGHAEQAVAREQIADDVTAAAEEWLTFLSESDAMLRSGRTKDWLRSRFAEWERDGHARLVNKQRQYRMCVVPRRYNLSDAREAGAEAARRHRKSA